MGERYRINQKRSQLLYSNRTRFYDIAHHLQTLWADTKHRQLVASTAALDEAYICLDVGCGTGLSIVEIASRYKFLKIIGVDISFEMVKVARNKLKRLAMSERVLLVNANAQSLPFDDACFDAVTSTYGFGGIPNPEDAMMEVVRVLKPAGIVCLGEMTTPPHTASCLSRWIHRRLVEPWIRYFWEFRDLDLICLFASAGLTVNSIQYHRNRFFGSMTLIRAIKPG